MKDAGFAPYGASDHAIGKGKAEEAAKMAVASPLMETSINGAHGVLINITGSADMGLDDVEAAANLVEEAAHPDANIIFGATFDDSLEDEIRVTVIATGFEDGKDKPGEDDPLSAFEKPREQSPAGLFTATEKKAEAPASAPAPAADEEDPFDSIFKIFNSK